MLSQGQIRQRLDNLQSNLAEVKCSIVNHGGNKADKKWSKLLQSLTEIRARISEIHNILEMSNLDGP